MDAILSDALMPVALPAEILLCDGRGGKPSASGMERLFLCPGSWQAEQLCPQEEESADAAAGTRLHKHMEDGTLPEDAAEAEAVVWCRRMELALAQRCLAWDDTMPPPTLRELRWWEKEGAFSGKPDAVFSDGCGGVLIVDYKFGRSEVAAAPGNLQLAALAVLAMDNMPDVHRVYATILQPFVCRQEPRGVVYTSADVEQTRAYIAKVIAKAQAPDAPLRRGVKQCKYCRAKATCPAALQGAMSCQAVERWEALDASARAELWRRAQLARKLADAIERRVKADLKGGAVLPGLELAPGRSSFTVTDAQGAYNVLSEQLGISAEEFCACCKVGITPLDKLVHAKRKAVDESARVKDSSAWLREALSACGEVKVTEGSVREVKGGAR